MKKLYRIHTENKNIEVIKAILQQSKFSGYTLTMGTGCWNGEEENSLTIEIYAADTVDTKKEIEQIAKAIMLANRQDTVMIATIDVAGVKFV